MPRRGSTAGWFLRPSSRSTFVSAWPGFSVFWLPLHALNRLRWMLKDQLFIRTPVGMMPTPRAEQFAQPVQMEPIKTKGVKRLILAGAAALAAFGAVAATGIVSRARSEHEIAQWTEQQAIPTLALAKLQQGAPVRDLTLPGTIEVYYRAEALAYLHGIMGKPRPPPRHRRTSRLSAVMSKPAGERKR